jgi:aspartyl-tRNA(Asn)/glutamyl-tRNA(Gln) amidotransferase subunit A
VRAYVTLLPEQALTAAHAAEQEIVHGTYRGPLHGIPIALKDLIDTAGVPTTWGSPAHAARVPREDAAVWTRLHTAGAILLGKSVTHEMGCGTLCPPTSNPWDLTRGPGGSSGGSAAALAAGLCLGALGTDTGGSVRIPAACCGVVGFKPTFGLLPRGGVMLASWSLDHVGPMARTVGGVARLLDAHLTLDGDVRGLRLGVPGGFFRTNVEPAVLEAVDAASGVLAAAGAQLVDVALPSMAATPGLGSLIALPELFALHRADLAHEVGPEVRLNLELGLVEPASAYVAALRGRVTVQRVVREVFETHALDGLLTPTLPITAAARDQAALAEDAYVRFCVAFNLAGVPALSVPCGFDTHGLPIGLQIVGRPFADATVLRIGHAYEQLTEWHVAQPRSSLK